MTPGPGPLANAGGSGGGREGITPIITLSQARQVARPPLLSSYPQGCLPSVPSTRATSTVLPSCIDSFHECCSQQSLGQLICSHNLSASFPDCHSSWEEGEGITSHTQATSWQSSNRASSPVLSPLGLACPIVCLGKEQSMFSWVLHLVRGRSSSYPNYGQFSQLLGVVKGGAWRHHLCSCATPQQMSGGISCLILCPWRPAHPFSTTKASSTHTA